MSNGPSPAVLALERTLKANIPFLAGTFLEWNDKTSPRLQIMTADGRHQTGLALDIILFSAERLSKDQTVSVAREKPLAENLVRAFVDLKSSMKWNEIILQDRFFREPDGVYGTWSQDNKHFTHIHIDWMTNRLKGQGKSTDEIVASSPQANEVGFVAALGARLSQLRGASEAGTLAGVPLSGLQKQWSADLNPVGDWRVSVGQWQWVYSFKADGTVVWRDPSNAESGKGKWWRDLTYGKLIFAWAESQTTEWWQLPLSSPAADGSTTMKGKTYKVEARRA